MSDLAVQGISLPGVPDPGDPIMAYTAAWLMSQKTRNTMLAYRLDVTGTGKTGKPAHMTVPAWLPWLEANGIHPFAARRGHVDTYTRLLDVGGCAPATVLRKISAISSWYTYLVREEVTDRNPAQWATRPAVDPHASATVGLSEDETRAFIAQGDAMGLRTAAIMRALIYGGWRVNTVITARISDLGHDRGHRTIRVVLKGGRVVKAPLSPPVTSALDNYLATREPLRVTALIFATATGGELGEAYLWRLVRRVAREAGIPSWGQLSPHSLRHTFATLSLGYGVPLADVQDALGHADPRTTRRYDRARHRLDRHPTYVLAGKLQMGGK
jgi:integrase/recombinase XerD